MNNRTRKQLEAAAIRAHADGDTWATFWPTVAADVAAAEPHDARRYHRLVRKLVALVASGETDGAQPVPATWGQPEPWELDDQAQAVPVIVLDDITTAARCLWSPGQEDADLPEPEARSGEFARLLALPRVTTAAPMATKPHDATETPMLVNVQVENPMRIG